METHTTRARPRSPQGEGAKLRDELIDAAGRLLEAGADIDTLTLRGVAREAGVAAPSVYLHFANKDALLRAVREAHFEALRLAIDRDAETVEDPASGLLAGCMVYCRYAMEHPGSYRVLFNTSHPALEGTAFSGSRGEAAFRTLVDGVAECIAVGIAKPGDPFRVATDIWPALHGAVSLRQVATGFPWPPLEDQIRGILEAFTGIPYVADAVEEESVDDRTEKSARPPHQPPHPG